MYKFTHYRVLFAKMLLVPYSKDIQPQICIITAELLSLVPCPRCCGFLSTISRYFRGTAGTPWTPQCAPCPPALLRTFLFAFRLWQRSSAPSWGSPTSHHLCRDQRRWPRGNVLVGTEAAHFSCLDTAVRGAASGTRQTSTASHAAPRAPLAASRQNASEVCTAAPALNNVRLCRRSPRSHSSATRINHASLGAGWSCHPNVSRRILPFLSEGLNSVSGKITDDSRSFG